MQKKGHREPQRNNGEPQRRFHVLICITPLLLSIAEYGNYLHHSLLTTKKWMNMVSGTQNGDFQPAGQ